MANWRDWGRLEISWTYLLIFLGPVSVLIASEYILGNFGNPDLDLGKVELVENASLIELAGRYRYMAAVFFYLAISIALILVFVFELVSEHKILSMLRTLIALFAAVGVALVFSMIEPVSMRSFESYQLLGEGLFRDALGQGKIARCDAIAAQTTPCEKLGAFAALTTLNGVINLVSALASAAVIAGTILALSRAGPRDLNSREGLLIEAEALEAAQSAARRYLYASAVLLTVGMAMGLAWMNWPTALIAEEGMSAAHQKLVESVSLFRGASYSALIMSYYIPVSLLLMVRTNRFNAAAAQHGGELAKEEAETWKARIGGFDVSKLASLDAMKAILAIVSPLLTSALGSFDKLPSF